MARTERKAGYVFRIEDFHEGNQKSLEFVFEHQWRKFVSFGCNYIDQHEAEDLISEILNQVWQKRFEFSDLQSLMAYVYTSIRNRALNVIRDKKVKNDREQAYADHIKNEIAEDSMEDSIRHIAQASLMQQMMTMTDQLPEKTRFVIQKTIAGERIRDIANEMRISTKVVYDHKKRGIDKLREYLRESDAFGGVLLVVIAALFK